MSVVDQGELYPQTPEQDFAYHFELMHGMLTEELKGLTVHDRTIDTIITVMTVAAESFARTYARSRGTIDPESDELLSETISSRLDVANRGESALFTINVDSDPEWAAVRVVDEPFLGYLTEKASTIGVALVSEQEEKLLYQSHQLGGDQ